LRNLENALHFQKEYRIENSFNNREKNQNFLFFGKKEGFASQPCHLPITVYF
jgi:uncharacterized protein YwgA